jgi:hypothetical protein
LLLVTKLGAPLLGVESNWEHRHRCVYATGVCMGGIQPAVLRVRPPLRSVQRPESLGDAVLYWPDRYNLRHLKWSM